MTTARVKHYAMLIGGDDIDWPQHMTIIDPSDESVVATVARGDASHIDAPVTAAKDAFDGGAWSRITPQELQKRLCGQGIPFRMVGSRILISRAAAEDWLRGNTVAKPTGGLRLDLVR